jgi:hypothetical protein
MIIRWVTYFVFVIAVVIGSIYHRHIATRSRAVWLAAMELKENTRISTNYLDKSECPTPLNAWGLPDPRDFDGKYVISTIPRGGEITFTNLSPMPQLFTMNDEILLFYPSQDLGSAGSYLNSGAKVWICESENGNENGPYTVKAVLGKSEPFTLVIQAPKVDAEVLRKISKPQLKLVSLQ